MCVCILHGAEYICWRWERKMTTKFNILFSILYALEYGTSIERKWDYRVPMAYKIHSSTAGRYENSLKQNTSPGIDSMDQHTDVGE